MEHDAEEIFQSSVGVLREALERSGRTAAELTALGITNQRETVVVWDKATGRPIHNAIVWQDRRTEPTCLRLRDAGREERVTELTGLLLDPYFSGTKLAWLLDHTPGAREKKLSALLKRAPDFEDQLNAARRFHREEAFRIGYQLLRGAIGASEAGTAYADLADACVIVLAEAGSMDDLGRLVVNKIQLIHGITRTTTCSVVHL